MELLCIKSFYSLKTWKFYKEKKLWSEMPYITYKEWKKQELWELNRHINLADIWLQIIKEWGQVRLWRCWKMLVDHFSKCFNLFHQCKCFNHWKPITALMEILDWNTCFKKNYHHSDSKSFHFLQIWITCLIISKRQFHWLHYFDSCVYNYTYNKKNNCLQLYTV